jgi:hypothetical protein
MNKLALMTTSWDDGHPSDFRLAGLLSKYGLTGTFYIPQRAENVTMSEAQIREMSQRFDIGAHTMRHTFLDTADQPTAEREITESKNWIEKLTGKPCTMFCPPGGRFDSRHLRLVAAAGYTGLRSVELLSLAEPTRIMDVMVLPTTVQAYPHVRRTYFTNIAKRLAVKNLCGYLRCGGSADWVELASRLLDLVSDEGGVFHLWGHSWELDETREWENLERFFAIMSLRLPNVPCVTNFEACTRTRSAPLSRAA